MAEKTTFLDVFTTNDGAFYSGTHRAEDREIKNIQILANGAKEYVEKDDTTTYLQKFFAEKNGLTGELTEEERDETLSLAAALKRTPRVTVYELVKGDDGRSDLVTTDHFVGTLNPGGRTFSVVDDNGESCRLAVEGNTVVHSNSDELVAAVGNQHLGISNFAEQVDTCALVAFDKMFMDTTKQQ